MATIETNEIQKVSLKEVKNFITALETAFNSVVQTVD